MCFSFNTVMDILYNVFDMYELEFLLMILGKLHKMFYLMLIIFFIMYMLFDTLKLMFLIQMYE